MQISLVQYCKVSRRGADGVAGHGHGSRFARLVRDLAFLLAEGIVICIVLARKTWASQRIMGYL